MRQKPGPQQSHGEKVVKDIRRATATRKQYAAEEKIRIVLDGLKGEVSLAELGRREGIAQSLCYTRPKPSRVWNRSPEPVRVKIKGLALTESDLSPRELAIQFTDTEKYFVSEASVYRILKSYDLISSPAYVVLSAADEFNDKKMRPNEPWQTDFTYLKVIGWAGSASAQSWTTTAATSSPGHSARR